MTTEQEDDRAAWIADDDERAASITADISSMIASEEDEASRASIVTTVVANWLDSYDEEEQPKMLAYMSGTALQVLGHNVKTMIEEGGKRTTLVDGTDEGLTATEETRHHAISDNEEVRAAVDLVIQKARDLKLHGVVILSPVCDGCGHLHDFAMVSDMGFGRGENLASLLHDFAEVAAGRNGPPEHSIRPIEGGTIQ